MGSQGARSRARQRRARGRAKIIHARRAAGFRKLYTAAQMLSKQPEAMQLRYLQTVTTCGDKTSTIVFPVR